MSEKIIQIEAINPIEIYGVNNENLVQIKKLFPKLKIIARGDKIKVIGNNNEVGLFTEKIELLLEYFNKYNQLTKGNIEKIMVNGIGEEDQSNKVDVLVYGSDGREIKPRTPNQRKMVEKFSSNSIVFAIGPAGTGKTYTAVALAVQSLKNKEVKRIVLTRPAVEAGENLGFLPGDLQEKLDPYLQPLYDALRDMIPGAKLKTYLEFRTIEIAPLAFMRGRTLDDAIVILDEAQNATEHQIKMLLTRMGKGAKILVTGDVTQIDLPKSQTSGLIGAETILKGIKGIEFIFLNEYDVVRHELVKKIIKAFENK